MASNSHGCRVHRRLLIDFVTLVSAVAAQASSTGSIIRLDPLLDNLVSSDARVETLYTGKPGDSFEGPAWVRDPAPGYLLFTNVPGNVIYQWEPDGNLSVLVDRIFTGDLSTAHRNGGLVMMGANGATLDRQGRLVYTSYSAGQIVRLESNGQRTVLAQRFEGKQLNAPNDVVVKSDGSIYFTDSRASSGHRSGPECAQFWMRCGNEAGVPHKGVYFLEHGVVRLLSRNVDHPNGLAFSPDERHLYVSNTLLRNIVRFDMRPDGTAANEAVFADLRGDTTNSLPDGIKVDVRGNVYCTGPEGIWIISPSGKHIGTIRTPDPERTTNFAFGGDHATTLYIVGVTTLSRISLEVQGIVP